MCGDSRDPLSLLPGQGECRRWGQNCGEILTNVYTFYHTKWGQNQGQILKGNY